MTIIDFTKKNTIYIFISFAFITVISVMNRCVVLPWKTIKYYSCKEYTDLNYYNGFIRLAKLYPESECNGVFMYTVSLGYNESLYSTKEPFAFSFVFYHYIPNVQIKVNSLTIKNEKGEYLPITLVLPIEVETENFENLQYVYIKKPPVEYIKSDCFVGNIVTDYIYGIKNCKSIFIDMDVEIYNGEKTETKILKQVLEKEVERGFFQYGF